MEKPRVTLAQYRAMQEQQNVKPTVAQMTERYIGEMGTNGTKPVGESQMYSMRAQARRPIGRIGAFDLTHHHVIADGRSRIEAGRNPATVMHDMSNLTVVFKYARAAWPDCLGLSVEPIAAAKDFLEKHGMVGKSTPRDRRPTPDELGTLIEYFNFLRTLAFCKMDMATLTVWQDFSGRRLSESCRAEWSHWNREDQTLTVYGMKDPRKRHKVKVCALTPEAQDLLCVMWEAREPGAKFIFGGHKKYNAKSASAAYTLAKKKLGIDGLRLHDSRRDCASKLIERGYTSPEAIQFTGHESTAIFERVYMRLKPEDMRHGPIKLRQVAA